MPTYPLFALYYRFTIIFLSKPKFSKCSLSPGFPTKILMYFFSSTAHMPHPSPTPSCHNLTSIYWTVQITTPFIMQFSLSSYNSLSLRLTYFPYYAAVSKTLPMFSDFQDLVSRKIIYIFFRHPFYALSNVKCLSGLLEIKNANSRR